MKLTTINTSSIFILLSVRIFAEMVARWVAHYRIPPGFLSKCSVSNHVLNLSRESSRVDDTDVEQDHDETAAMEQLQGMS